MRISIIALTYNHEEYIEDFLNSAKYQEETYNPDHRHHLQIIVSDDCSKDNTIDVVERWRKNNQEVFEDFVFIKNSNNLGTCRNYLNALDVCDGDCIKAIGGDDILPETSVFMIASYLEYYDMVYGLPFTYYENEDNDVKEMLRILRKMNAIQNKTEKTDFYRRIHRSCCINAPATYISKELLTDERVKSFLATYKYTDDYPQWLKMSEIKKISTAYIPMITVIYRRTEKSAYIVRRDDLLNERIRSFEYALNTCNELIGKLLLKSTLKNMDRIKKGTAPHCELLQYVQEFYWLKNRKIPSPYTYELVNYTLQYVENIKNLRTR